MNENEARALIERFAEKQQGGRFACPRCGKMAMDAESVTRNALSRRATVYICDACGMQEALEDMMDSITPLTAWAIAAAPQNWRMRRHYSAAAWRVSSTPTAGMIARTFGIWSSAVKFQRITSVAAPS